MSRKGKRANKVKLLRKMARIYYYLSKINLWFPKTFGKRMGIKDLACNLAMPYAEAMEAESNVYMTYDFYPKKAEDLIEHVFYPSETLNKCAILLRGLIVQKYEFTLETIRLYKKIFPGALVVLSIWDDVNSDVVRKFEEESNCVVELNNIPPKAGRGNSYYQQVTKVGGIKRAISEGREYILETRSDIRVTQTGVIDQLVSLLEQYPVTDKRVELSSRLISFNAYLIKPYHQNDFFSFGRAEDLLKFYDSPFFDDDPVCFEANDIIGSGTTYRQIFEHPFGEIYALTQFFKRYMELQCSIDQWWDVLSKYMICCQASMLRPIWYKYDYNHEQSNFLMEHRRSIMGGMDARTTTVTFGMWLDMFNGCFKLVSSDYEKWLDMSL